METSSASQTAKNDNETASCCWCKKKEYELTQHNNNTETRKTTRTVRKQNWINRIQRQYEISTVQRRHTEMRSQQKFIFLILMRMRVCVLWSDGSICVRSQSPHCMQYAEADNDKYRRQ